MRSFMEKQTLDVEYLDVDDDDDDDDEYEC